MEFGCIFFFVVENHENEFAKNKQNYVIMLIRKMNNIAY